jgi:hypothetical protein
VTDDAPNKTVQPASIMGANPPSECCKPGTRCAGTVNAGAIMVVPDEVAYSLLPSGCMMGAVSLLMLLLGVIRWLSLLLYSMCVHPLSAINVLAYERCLYVLLFFNMLCIFLLLLKESGFITGFAAQLRLVKL